MYMYSGRQTQHLVCMHLHKDYTRKSKTVSINEHLHLHILISSMLTITILALHRGSDGAPWISDDLTYCHCGGILLSIICT